MKYNLRGFGFFILVIIAIALLSGCSPQKRLARLLKKYPELSTTTTETRIDTITIQEVKADTIFRQTKDTVVLQKDRLTMKYFYSNDTVFLSGTCKDSLIIREVPVTVTKVVTVKESLWSAISKNMWVWVALVGVVALLLIVLRMYLLK